MNLNNILARAQQMMLSEDFNRDVERAAAATRGQKGGGEDFSAMEEALFGASTSTPQGYAKTPLPENVKYNTTSSQGVHIIKPVAEQRDMSNTKIPKAILESFKKTPSPVDAFDVDTINAQLHGSIDDAIGALPKVNEQRAPVTEQRQQQYSPQGGGQIDYNYLKYIINECVKESLKGKLNESAGGTIAGMKIAPGNKFQFLDSKGNLYEAQLTLKKKAGK